MYMDLINVVIGFETKRELAGLEYAESNIFMCSMLSDGRRRRL